MPPVFPLSRPAGIIAAGFVNEYIDPMGRNASSTDISTGAPFAGWDEISTQLSMNAAGNLIPTTNGEEPRARWNVVLPSVDMFTEITVGPGLSVGSSFEISVGPLARLAAAADTAYMVVYDGTSLSALSLKTYRINAGSFTQVGSTVTNQTLAAGDRIKITTVTNGANVDLKGYLNDIQKIATTDSSSPLTTGVRGGVDLFRAQSSADISVSRVRVGLV